MDMAHLCAQAECPDIYEQCPLRDRSTQIRLLQFAAVETTIVEASYDSSNVVERRAGDGDQRSDTKAADEDGLGDLNVSCSMRTYDLTDMLQYHAVSYTWGDPDSTQSILINDQEFSVRQNCWYALRQIRARLLESCATPALIWIDAISINQDDVVEKSAQVGMMAEIYEKASSVFACIGADCEDSGYLLEHALNADMKANNLTGPPDKTSVDGKVKGGHRYAASSDLIASIVSDQEGEPALRCVSAFRGILHDLDNVELVRVYHAAIAIGNRHYWERAWIQQELTIPKRIHVLCGTHCVPWDLVRRLVTDLRGNDATVMPKVQGLNNLAVRVQLTKLRDLLPFIDRAQNGMFWTIGDVLRRNFACSAARDRIYSMLKIIDWAEGVSPILADYSRTPFQLAKEAVAYYRSEDRWETVFGFAKALMVSLRVADGDTELDRMLQYREQLSVGDQDTLSESGKDHCSKYLVEDKLSHYGRLVTTNGNLLSAPFETMEEFDDQSEWLGTDAVLLPPGLQKVVSDVYPSKVVGVVSVDAQPKDIILAIGWARIVVVLREHGGLFEIIGSGFIVTGANMCFGAHICRCFDESSGLVHPKQSESWDLAIGEYDFWALISSSEPLGYSDISEAALSEALERFTEPFCGYRYSSYATRSQPKERVRDLPD